MQNENIPNAIQNQAPIIAKLDDIDKEHARRAFYWTSFKPDERGESRRQKYVDSVNGLYAELWPLASTEGQKSLLAAKMVGYRQGYLDRMNAFLASHAHVASAMITGPARFPTARNEKRSRWADAKAEELFSWEKKARESIKRQLLDARPKEEKEASEWRIIENSILKNLNAIEQIDAGQSHYTRSAFVNSLTGQVERIALNGEIGFTDKSLELVKAYGERYDKPAISARHKFWTFGKLARQQAAQAEATATSEPETIAEADGVKIVANPQADRVQIVFAEKPPAEMIAKLKGEAWKWSPNAGAWQRKMTEAAKHSAKRITGL